MKKLVLIVLFLLCLQGISAQINAVTETGDEVILYDDGTWKFLNDSLYKKTEIPINEKEFRKDEKSTFLVKSKKINIGIWINPKIWSFTTGSGNDAFEFQFQKKGGDLYAMLITEKIQIPIETLKKIAIQNAKSAAPDIKITDEEYRNVNGLEVLMMQLSGTIQGLKFRYYGYYFSNSNGTIQLLAFTGENLFENYREDIELLLNGLVEF